MDGDGDYGFSRHRHVSAQAVGREDFGELSRAAPATSETPRTAGSPTSRSTRSADAAEGKRYRVAGLCRPPPTRDRSCRVRQDLCGGLRRAASAAPKATLLGPGLTE